MGIGRERESWYQGSVRAGLYEAIPIAAQELKITSTNQQQKKTMNVNWFQQVIRVGEASGGNRYTEHKLLTVGRGIKKHLALFRPRLWGTAGQHHVPTSPINQSHKMQGGQKPSYSQLHPASKLPKDSSSADWRREGKGRLQQENCLLTPSHFQSSPLTAVGDNEVSSSCTPDAIRVNAARSFPACRLAVSR